MDSTLDVPLANGKNKTKQSADALKLSKEAFEKAEEACELSRKSLEASKRVEAKIDSFELFLRRFSDKMAENPKETDGPATKRGRFEAMTSPTSDNSCFVCHYPHASVNCRNYPDGLSRQMAMDREGSCKQCAGSVSHLVCPNENKKCEYCSEAHLIALCPKLFPVIKNSWRRSAPFQVRSYEVAPKRKFIPDRFERSISFPVVSREFAYQSAARHDGASSSSGFFQTRPTPVPVPKINADSDCLGFFEALDEELRNVKLESNEDNPIVLD